MAFPADDLLEESQEMMTLSAIACAAEGGGTDEAISQAIAGAPL